MKILLTLITSLITFNLSAQMAVTVPAEYEKNDGVLLTWPYNPPLDSVVAEISGLAAASGDVWLLYNADSILTDTTAIRTFLQATGNNHNNIKFIPVATNTAFIREYAPVTGYGVFNQTLVRYFGDPVFNSYNRPQDDSVPFRLADYWQSDYVPYTLAFEPGNIVTDGEKNLFVSTRILEENPSLSQADISQQLSSVYNVPDIVFLTAPEHSGGGMFKSIDMFVKMLDSETVLMTEVPDSLPDYPVIESNVSLIQNITNTYETPYKIVRVQAAPPDNGHYDTTLTGELRSYTNSLILNNLIIIPSYNNPEYDSAAYNAYKNNTYGMNIKMVDARKLSLLHAAVHTITKERPQEHYLRINHKKLEGAQEYQGDEFTVHCLATGDDVIDHMWLYYRFNNDTAWQKTMVFLVCPTHYGIIQNVQLTDTISYYLEATSVNGTTITYPLSAPDGYFTFWFDVTGTGLQKSYKTEAVIYPNPVNSYFVVSNIKSDKPVVYKISDFTGKMLQQGVFKAGQKVSVSRALNPGSYILTLKTAQTLQSIKFIKQ